MSQTAAGLDASDPNSLRTVRLQPIFVDGLRQISTLAKRIVTSVLNPWVPRWPTQELNESPGK